MLQLKKGAPEEDRGSLVKLGSRERFAKNTKFNPKKVPKQGLAAATAGPTPLNLVKETALPFETGQSPPSGMARAGPQPVGALPPKLAGKVAANLQLNPFMKPSFVPGQAPIPASIDPSKNPVIPELE